MGFLQVEGELQTDTSGSLLMTYSCYLTVIISHFTQVLEHFDGSTHAISRHWQPGKLVLLSLATPHPHQVCNLAWSKHASELVSTHGYSQNQILVWKYPSLVQVIKAAVCLTYE